MWIIFFMQDYIIYDLSIYRKKEDSKNILHKTKKCKFIWHQNLG